MDKLWRRGEYIELGNGEFVNADQVKKVGVSLWGGADRVLIWSGEHPDVFHFDRVHGPEARSALLALLAELGRHEPFTGKLRVITFVDGSVQSRFL